MAGMSGGSLPIRADPVAGTLIGTAIVLLFMAADPIELVLVALALYFGFRKPPGPAQPAERR
jgi:hypothetical protein